MSSIWDYHMMKGPWRIVPQCPSTKHNSWSAARDGLDGVYCICPRSVAMMKAKMPGAYRAFGIPWRISGSCKAQRHNIPVEWVGKGKGAACTCPASFPYVAKRKAHDAKRRAGYVRNRKEKKQMVASSLIGSLSRTMPDLSNGLCRLPQNIDIFDAAFDESAAGRALAKSVCCDCPVIQECDAWAVREEFPAGDWGGVYGGRDVYDRRKGWQPPRPLISMERKSIEAQLQGADVKPDKVAAKPYARGGLGGIKAGGFRWNVR